MKYALIGTLRALGVLRGADLAKYWWRRARLSGRNRRFRASHPGFAVPPADLAYDAYNHCDWFAYLEGGKKHAEVFAGLIDAETAAKDLSVLEWGCGPGRIIRHIRALLPSREVRLIGTDYNDRSIAWCLQHLPDIDFMHNELMPPLDLPPESFDAVYNFSVFTHLSEAAQQAWVAELSRVLKPGGIMISTTHGDNYRYLLVTKAEKEQYARGEVVVQGNYREGKKWFFALHPDAYVRGTLFGAFDEVRRVGVSPEAGLLQDVWVARKPVAGAQAGQGTVP